MFVGLTGESLTPLGINGTLGPHGFEWLLIRLRSNLNTAKKKKKKEASFIPLSNDLSSLPSTNDAAEFIGETHTCNLILTTYHDDLPRRQRTSTDT